MSDGSRGGLKGKIDIAQTLMARDYKGLSNYGSNGVIETRRIDEKNRK